ncbi:hypothetical protein ACFL6O_00520 [candidate division KSB1 bacterium]
MLKHSIFMLIFLLSQVKNVIAFQDEDNTILHRSTESIESEKYLFPANADKFRLPWITAGYTYGYFGSSIKNFEDEHIRRGMTGGVFAFRTIKNMYLIYQIGHIVCKKAGIGYSPHDHFGRGKLTFFRENIHNVGFRLAFPEAILESKEFYFWIGGGFARLNSNNVTHQYKTEIIYGPDGGEYVDTKETTEKPLSANGFYSEIGIMFVRSIFVSEIIPSIGMGINIKYDSGSRENTDLGGISIMMQVNLIVR